MQMATSPSLQSFIHLNHSQPTKNLLRGETLPLLQGKWVREESEEYIIFRGNEICCGYGKDLKNCGEFVTVRRNGERDKKCFGVVNKDPSKNMLGYYVNMRYEHGVITAQIPVCDAPQIIISFKKA